ncbi:MAG: cyclic nucleotide-binding domain-containing protein [Thermodesulfobacteriota bacterium]|nr:cyclic nucleotide-binding domain-containing protein [Thermodesulfobacteriota bacterium]
MTVNSQVLGYIVSEESYSDKAVIVKEGSVGDWVYVILEGRVKIKKRTFGGLLTIDTLSEGDFVGEMAMLKQSNIKRTAWAVADGPVILGVLDSVRLAQEWESQPARIKKLISNLIQNIEESTQKAADMIVASK